MRPIYKELNQLPEKVLMKGNEALAEAAVLAGCRHFYGYPITPQNELAAYMSRRMPKVGGTFLQAESEIAAIHMVIGAASTGERTMTGSSSPGIALKGEGLSYMAGCDLPALIVNVQRAGPGLGGIQPAQADYFQATRGMGHGDFKMLVLSPSTIQEMVDLTRVSFDLAETYRMPALMLTDGIMGQMMEPVVLPEPTPHPACPDWAVGNRESKGRRVINSLYLQPADLENVLIERYKRYDVIERNEPRHDSFLLEDADIVLAAYGASARIAKNVVLAARAEGIKAGLLRPITLWPFPKNAFAQAAKTAKAFVSVEMSMGQMIEDIHLAIRHAKPVTLSNRTGGMVPQPDEILEDVRKAAKGGA